jgi:AraC-like DNA-binding protein
MTQSISFRTNEYSNSDLSDKVSLLNKIIVDEKLYKSPDLNLKFLSEKSKIPQKTISFILNHNIKKGFNDYINEYRIHDALIKIKSNETQKLTLEGIAFEVGFSSRSTFYRAFKKVTTKHPSDYIKKNQ